jgi:hypothetical protein
MSSRKVSLYSCPILRKIVFSRQIFLKKCSNITFHQNPSCGNGVVPCGQTDITKLTVTFNNSANTNNKMHNLTPSLQQAKQFWPIIRTPAVKYSLLSRQYMFAVIRTVTRQQAPSKQLHWYIWMAYKCSNVSSTIFSHISVASCPVLR